MNIYPLIKKYKVYIFFILILLMSAFLRFHRLSNIYVFNLDEEYQVSYALTLVKHIHLVWIGLVAAALEFYVGPYVVYLTAILLKFSNGDPLINAYFAASLGVITTSVVFWVGRKIFNLRVAIIAATLYATLPLFVFFDQKYWNPMFGPMITILLFMSLVLVKQSKWWWIAFAALAGAIFETHLPPFPLLLIGAWYFFKGKYFKDIKLLALCFVIFLLFYWPLIVFDINHNFSNLKVFTRISGGNNKNIIDPISKLGTFFDSMGRFWYLKPNTPNADEVNFGCSSLSKSNGFKTIDKYTQRTYSPLILSLISFGMLLYFVAINIISNKYENRLLATFLTVSGFSFLIYPGGAYEYYLLCFLSLFVFVPAFFISQLSGRIKIVAVSLLFLVVILAINTVLNTSDEFSLKPKKNLIADVMNIIGNQSFSIEGRGICHNYEGWRYLFKAYGRSPAQSYTDSGLGWLYPNEINKAAPIYTVILSEDRIPLDEDLSKLYSIKEGGYRAYIKKNQ